MESAYEPTKQDISILREWISKTPHIVQDYDDYALTALIRASKGRIQKAKATLEAFNALGYRFPRMFGHLDPLDKLTQTYLNATFLFPLPRKTEDGSVVFIFAPKKAADLDLTYFDVHELPRVWLMTYLVALWEKSEGNGKVILIHDYSGETLSRAKTMTPKYLRDCMQLAEAFPLRLQASHFVNIHSFMQPILNFVKSVAKSKLAKRLYFHSTIDGLYEHIPRKYLPEEYGGSEANFQTLHDIWRNKIESYRYRLIETSDKMRKLDPLRPKSEENDELQGTFRQLQID